MTSELSPEVYAIFDQIENVHDRNELLLNDDYNAATTEEEAQEAVDYYFESLNEAYS